MTAPAQENTTQQENKTIDKENNFRALHAKYEKQLNEERAARQEAEKVAQELLEKAKKVSSSQDDDDDDSEPYVDKKRLRKQLNKFGEETIKQTQNEIQKAVHIALQEERKQNWLKTNGDFYDIMQHADKLAQKDPEMAESLLQMPDGFERQKLVYRAIKTMSLHMPEKKESTIQEKVDANRRTPYYQPSGVGAAPYSSQGDYSPSGQKQAFDKMQELKSRLRLG